MGNKESTWMILRVEEQGVVDIRVLYMDIGLLDIWLLGVLDIGFLDIVYQTFQ